MVSHCPLQQLHIDRLHVSVSCLARHPSQPISHCSKGVNLLREQASTLAVHVLYTCLELMFDWVQGLVGLFSNPVLANGVAGLATSATAFAAVERTLLFQRRNTTVAPFGETVQQVFSRVSALRDSLDGPQVRFASFMPATWLCSTQGSSLRC